MKHRIISDTHFYHNLLIEIGDREVGYEERLFSNLLKIPKEDILIHLGDVCIGYDKLVHI